MSFMSINDIFADCRGFAEVRVQPQWQRIKMYENESGRGKKGKIKVAAGF